jgi:hydrogenase maturation protease
MSGENDKTARVLIIGRGDSLRGDDGIGPLAAQRLGEKFKQEPRVSTLSVDRLTADLAHVLGTIDLAIFIESAQGQRPGHLSCTFVTPSPGALDSQASGLDPGGLLDAVRSAQGRTPQAMVFTVAGEDFGRRQALSRVVERASQRLIDQVYRIVLDELDHT